MVNIYDVKSNCHDWKTGCKFLERWDIYGNSTNSISVTRLISQWKLSTMKRKMFSDMNEIANQALQSSKNR